MVVLCVYYCCLFGFICVFMFCVYQGDYVCLFLVYDVFVYSREAYFLGCSFVGCGFVLFGFLSLFSFSFTFYFFGTFLGFFDFLEEVMFFGCICMGLYIFFAHLMGVFPCFFFFWRGMCANFRACVLIWWVHLWVFAIVLFLYLVLYFIFL
jgi:hypothetical protein